MGSTAPLTVLGDFSMREKTINTHPNDALGMLWIRNEVRQRHIELELKAAKRRGARREIVHYTRGERHGTILISPV